MWGLFNLDAQSQIKEEAGTLNDTRTEIEKWDVGDRLRSALTGVSKEQIMKGVAEREAKAINNSLVAQTAGIQEALGGTGFDVADLSIQEGVSETDHKKKLAQLQAKGVAATRYAGLEGSSLGKVKGDMSTQEINKLYTDQQTTNKEAAETKAKGVKDSDREYARGIVRETREHNKGLLQAANLRADKKEERMLTREDRKDARASLERAETRKDNLMLRRDNMQLEYARLAQADRRSAQDRKDKALMTLISGLGNLGAAFTI